MHTVHVHTVSVGQILFRMIFAYISKAVMEKCSLYMKECMTLKKSQCISNGWRWVAEVSMESQTYRAKYMMVQNSVNFLVKCTLQKVINLLLAEFTNSFRNEILQFQCTTDNHGIPF